MIVYVIVLNLHVSLTSPTVCDYMCVEFVCVSDIEALCDCVHIIVCACWWVRFILHCYFDVATGTLKDL